MSEDNFFSAFALPMCIIDVLVTMTFSKFDAPHCYRARCDDLFLQDQQHQGENEGFFFVYSGVIEIHHESSVLRVYEEEVWQEGNAPALLTIDLSHRLTEIEFQMIRSRHSRYGAGRVRITCPTDRGFIERITLKVTQETYRRLGCLLVSIGV